jgi:hypothetical protein
MNFADQEEIAIRQKNRVKKRRHDVLWNSLTVLFVVASVAAVGYFLFLFANPASALNPYPPPTLPALIQIPTATLTPIPVATATSMPTVTTEVTFEPTAATSEPTSQITPTPFTNGDYLFAIEGKPVGMANTTFHPSLDCNWQGVAGKITDIQGKGISNITIVLTGYYNSKPVEQSSISGVAANFYGDGGYEIVLEIGSAPIASTGQLTIQLKDSSYVPLSPEITFDTYAECDKNLILINFQQAH